jgi:hypothetical protein
MRHQHRRPRPETMGRVNSVTITRAEGPTNLCGKPMTFPSTASASRYLRGQSSTFPGPGQGYDKHDFSATFRNGDTYRGRLDCRSRNAPDNDLDVAHHMRAFTRFQKTGRRMFRP